MAGENVESGSKFAKKFGRLGEDVLEIGAFLCAIRREGRGSFVGFGSKLFKHLQYSFFGRDDTIGMLARLFL